MDRYSTESISDLLNQKLYSPRRPGLTASQFKSLGEKKTTTNQQRVLASDLLRTVELNKSSNTFHIKANFEQ